MRYFVHRDNGQLASISSEKLILEFLRGTMDQQGNVIRPSDWVEITMDEYNGIIENVMKWNGNRVVKYVADQPNEMNDTILKNKYDSIVQALLNREGYDDAKVQAIVCNYLLVNDAKREEHVHEFQVLQEVRSKCKDEAYQEVYGIER